MCLSYLFVLSPFLFSCLFFSKGGGRFTSGTYYFLFAPTFFLKMAYYPSFFTLKCHFLVKIQNIFLAHSDLINQLIIFSGSTLQNIKFLVLTPKGSLFSLYYCHSYYPAYLMWNLFLTTHCDKFCTWKSPAIPTFFTPKTLLFRYFSQIFIATFPFFFVEGT